MRSLIPTIVILALVVSCVTAQSSTKPNNIPVGVIAVFSYPPADPNIPSSPYIEGKSQPMSLYNGFGKGSDQYVSIKHAIQQINNQTTLLPYHQLSTMVFDDQYIRERGFTGALQHINNGAKAMLGCSSSGPSTSAEFVTRNYQMPLLSWAASSPSLADKRQAPYFMRICQNDAAQAVAIAWLVKNHFKWTESAILYTNDPYGSFGASTYVNAAKDLYNMTILSEQGFPINSIPSDISSPLDRIKASGARIIVYFGQPADWLNVVAQAKTMGMWTNQTVWFVSDAIPGYPIEAEDKAEWPGVIAIAPDGGSGTQKYKQWVSDFLSRPYEPIPEERWSGAEEDVNFYMAFAADSVTVLATALHELIYTQGLNNSWTSRQLFLQLQKTDINGITGRIRFDQNFDRIGVNFQLLNLGRDTNWHVIGTYTDGVYQGDASGREIVWIDGTTNVPRDKDLPPEPIPPPTSLLGDASHIVFIILPAIFLGVIALLLCVLYIFRTSRVLHAASPVMLALVLLGATCVTLSVLLSAFPQAKAICTVEVWLFNLGFQLAFGALFLRTYRVHKIFNNKKLVVTTFNDSLLLQMLGVALLFDIIVLSLRAGVSPYTLNEKNVCTFSSGQKFDAAQALNGILIATKGLIILAGAYLSYAVRNLPQLYNESSWLGVAIYNNALLSCIWLGVTYGIDFSDHPASMTVFDSAIKLVTTGLTLSIMMGPKLVELYHSERDATFHNRIRRKAGETFGGASMLSSMPGGGTAAGSPKSHGAGALSGFGGATAKGNAGTLAAAPKTVVDILRLLQKVHVDTQASIEKLLGEIRRMDENVGNKKRDVVQATDMLYQVQTELDYFEQLRAGGVSDNELLQLFEARLAEFGAMQPAKSAPVGKSSLGFGGSGAQARMEQQQHRQSVLYNSVAASISGVSGPGVSGGAVAPASSLSPQTLLSPPGATPTNNLSASPRGSATPSLALPRAASHASSISTLPASPTAHRADESASSPPPKPVIAAVSASVGVENVAIELVPANNMPSLELSPSNNPISPRRQIRVHLAPGAPTSL